ncbi:MAG: hypothetical protein FJX48_15015 [Alphaproteobacteria bacterium]|nr:hypothetical protein [Alphaproteobacteria bacterium]
MRDLLVMTAHPKRSISEIQTNPECEHRRGARRADGILTAMPDEGRQQQSDTARPSATRYSLTLDETARLFAEAGLPRNIRSLQRYCAAGRLDCIKEETVTGLTFFVDPESVDRAITQLAQLHGITDQVRHSAVELDMSHRVAPFIEPSPQFDLPRASAAERDTGTQEIPERQTPPKSDMSRYVAQVESENAMLKEHVTFLKEQAQVKDTQIAALLERATRKRIISCAGCSRCLRRFLAGAASRRNRYPSRIVTRPT